MTQSHLLVSVDQGGAEVSHQLLGALVRTEEKKIDMTDCENANTPTQPHNVCCHSQTLAIIYSQL